MSERPGHVIRATVDDDGTVLFVASDFVEFLRAAGEMFEDGHYGGSRRARRTAREALNKVADGVQTSYVDVAADIVLDRWEGDR